MLMSLHPEYPDLVKTALASDLYWQTERSEAFFTEYQDIHLRHQQLKDTVRISRDGQMASRIGSVVTSLEAGGTIEQIPYGEPLPIPHSRQVVKVIEDSRSITSRLSPVFQISQLIISRSKARTIKAAEYFDLGFVYPTFEENLEKIHKSDLTFGPAAKAIIPRGITKIAELRRGVFYLKYDEQSGQFAALPSTFSLVPEVWDKGHLSVIPQTTVGEVYRKDMLGLELGRVIAADLVEANSVVWKSAGGSRGRNNKVKKSIKDLLPKSTALHTSA